MHLRVRVVFRYGLLVNLAAMRSSHRDISLPVRLTKWQSRHSNQLVFKQVTAVLSAMSEGSECPG